MATTVLWINDTAMPTPSAITITKEPIWSSNAGRNSNGKFVGDLVCYKFTIKIEWPVLTQKQTAKIDDAITADAFVDVKFINPVNADGDYVTKTCYAGTPTYPVYSYADGMPRHVGTAVDMIQQ